MDQNTTVTHPAGAYDRDLQITQRRGLIAILALGLTMIDRAADIAACAYQNSLIAKIESSPGSVSQALLELSDKSVQATSIGILVLLLITGIVFLQWLHRLVRTAKNLGAFAAFSPKDVVLGFITPVVNFKRPYELVKATHDALDPSLVPTPMPQLVAVADGGYRDAKVAEPPPPVNLPHAAIGAWWTAFWIGNVIARVANSNSTPPSTLASISTHNTAQMLASAVEIVAAALAIVMVRGLTARLVEWHRRVRHNSVDALTAAGIVIQSPSVA